MPLSSDPHFYDSIAGFDASTLYNNGSFAASALTNGTGGNAVADAVLAVNAANEVTAAQQAIALINKVSADNGVSPITSLLTFIHELVAINHNTDLVQYVETAVANLVNAHTVTATNAVTEATAAAIVIAHSGSPADAVAAGSEISQVLSQVRLSGGGDGNSPYPWIVAQIQSAVGGSLTVNQAIDMLVGMPLGDPGADSNSQPALQALIGADTIKASFAIAAFATAVGRADSDLALAGFGSYNSSTNEAAAAYCMDFGRRDVSYANAPGSVGLPDIVRTRLTVQQALVGINYKFNLSGPVVAKY